MFLAKIEASRLAGDCAKLQIKNVSEGLGVADYRTLKVQLIKVPGGQTETKDITGGDTAVFDVDVTDTLFQVNLLVASKDATVNGQYGTDVQYPCVPGVTSAPLTLPLY